MLRIFFSTPAAQLCSSSDLALKPQLVLLQSLLLGVCWICYSCSWVGRWSFSCTPEPTGIPAPPSCLCPELWALPVMEEIIRRQWSKTFQGLRPSVVQDQSYLTSKELITRPLWSLILCFVLLMAFISIPRRRVTWFELIPLDFEKISFWQNLYLKKWSLGHTINTSATVVDEDCAKSEFLGVKRGTSLKENFQFYFCNLIEREAS